MASRSANDAKEEQKIHDVVKQHYRHRPPDFKQLSPAQRLPWNVFPSKSDLLRDPICPAVLERIQKLVLAAYNRQLPPVDGKDCLPEAVDVLARSKIIAVLRYMNQTYLFDAFLTAGVSDDALPLSKETIYTFILNKQHANDFFKHQYRAVVRNFHSRADHTAFKEYELAPLKIVRTLGRGSYGLVRETENIYSSDRYALKTVSVRGKMRREKANEEVRSLKKLRLHRHFVQLVGSYEIGQDFGLLFSPVADCNLYEYLQESTAASSEDFVVFLNKCFGCLASALEYMHSKQIRHKDIKPSNILVHGQVVLFTDFGLAQEFGENTLTSIATGLMSTGAPEAFTRRYAPPEVLSFERRNDRTDIFSLGCVYLEIIVSLVDNELQMFEDALQGDPDDPEDLNYSECARKALDYVKKRIEENDRADLRILLDWCAHMVELDQDKRPIISQVCKEISAITLTQDDHTTYCCKECLEKFTSSGNNSPSCSLPTIDKSRIDTNFCNKDQENPEVIFGALRQTAHDEYEKFKERQLEETPDPPLFTFIRHGDINEVRRILDEGSNANSECRGKSALHWAADNGFENIAALLIERGADLNGRDSSAMTALHWAAFEDHPTLVDYFLKLGAEWDTTDQWGDSPLEDARGRFQHTVVELLEEAQRKKYGRKQSTVSAHEILLPSEGIRDLSLSITPPLPPPIIIVNQA